MPKERANFSITERQKRQLQKRSEEEHIPLAELIRRARDAYLAWDDPTYAPHHPNPPETRKGHSSPAEKRVGFLARLGKVSSPR